MAVSKRFGFWMFLYHFLWTFSLLLSMPFLMIFKRKDLSRRFGLGIPSIPISSGNIWVHALSVGEVISAIPLVRALEEKFPGKNVVFTVTTRKGMEIAESRLKGDVKALAYMPVDFWGAVRRVVSFLSPSLFIVVETDLWPATIDYLNRKGIKSILVNGRVSPRTFKSYKRYSFFVRMIFKGLTSCLVQSSIDRERMLEIGVEPEKVLTMGNIKYDRSWLPMDNEERRKWKEKIRLESKAFVWVAGSTHEGEEEMLLDVFVRLKGVFPELRLILAPRKTERSREVAAFSKDMGIKTCLRTDVSGKEEDPYDVLVLDTMGELGRIYGLGAVSFVGGSMVPFGGHNLLEPASFGCPVVFGPYTHNFVEMSESLEEFGGGLRVGNREELYGVMESLLGDWALREKVGRLAADFVRQNQGALDKVLSHIAMHIS